MKRTLLVLTVAAAAFSCGRTAQVAQPGEVIPRPAAIEADEAAAPFVLDASTRIVCATDDEPMLRNAEFLRQYVAELTGIEPAIAPAGEAPAGKDIRLTTGLDAESPEAYRLTIGADGVTIEGASDAGVFYGIQTLRKSLPAEPVSAVELTAVRIDDAPRFGYRGLHFDCSRHFFPADFVKRLIDLLALHNCNRLHWHLTDDQGWRLEIKNYPRLTEVGSVRAETVIGHNSGEYDGTPHGGFYTQEEAREIVAYAAERHITIVPEIDMPGHMLAALTAYPELGCRGEGYAVWGQWGVADDVLCAGREETFAFVEGVLDEVLDIFPSEVIHIGGDECPKVRWAECPRCQSRIRAEGLRATANHTAEQELQSYFTQRVARYLAERGRRVLGWDEILEGGIPQEVMVMSWRGEAGGIEAARKGHEVVMTPNSYLYFDYYQTRDTDKEPLGIGGYVPFEAVYRYEPMSTQLTEAEQRLIRGVQANLWTEYITTPEHAEYMILPRLAALCEVQWSRPERKDYDSMMDRLPRMMRIYDRYGYNYAKHLLGVDAEFGVDLDTREVTAKLTTLGGAPIRYTLDGTDPATKGLAYGEPVRIASSATLAAVAERATPCEPSTYRVDYTRSTACPVTLLAEPHPSYRYAGGQLLADGLKGTDNFRTGRWIGFFDTDLVAVIDLGAPATIAQAAAQVCVHIGEGCFDARSFKVEVSNDGERYAEVAAEEYPAMADGDKNGVYPHRIAFEPVEARYVKVTLGCEHVIPAWHSWGAGTPGFLFVDEIGIE